MSVTPQNDESTAPRLSKKAVHALLSSATWARALGVLGVAGWIVVVATFFREGDMGMTELLVTIAVTALIILLPAFLLFRYAGKAKVAAANGRTDQFDEAFNALKGFLVICCIMGVLAILLFLFLTNIRWGKKG